MGKIKPIETNSKFGIIGFIILATALVGMIVKWHDFYEFFVPNGSLLNWRFVFITLMLSMLVVWFIMNHFWKKEYEEHQKTVYQRDNYWDQLKLSENERLTDVITGIPNSQSLENDIKDFFSKRRTNVRMQFILIDLKNFRHVNKKYGFLRADKLLRTIAQSVYKKMRRNEDMYKYPSDESKKAGSDERIYRVYPGGDEFAFMIEGDQSDALGFANRLVIQFNALSKKTVEILGEPFILSFHCAIVEVANFDTIKDIFEKAEKCYRRAMEGTQDFTLCWHPINIESKLEKDQRKQSEYKRARELFEVLSFVENEYN